jgi:pimeloyl-ACP methyl ester carboxylesterase
MAVLAPNPRYLTGGSGPPLVMLHTVRTQAEHFRHLIPLVEQGYTLYALDLPGMGYSQVVPEASYAEPAMRAAVKRLVTQLDLRDVTLLGESMGATLAFTAAADLPDRVGRVVSVNPYDYSGGIARSSLLARLIVTGVKAPGIGPILAGQEPKPVMRAILAGGLALVYADQILGAVPEAIRREWSVLRSEAMVGQFLDVVIAAEYAFEPERSRWVAVCKSGRYSIQRPLSIGAQLAVTEATLVLARLLRRSSIAVLGTRPVVPVGVISYWLVRGLTAGETDVAAISPSGERL